MKLKEQLGQMRRNSIVLDLAGQGVYKLGGTRFGGQPDVPSDFVWPRHEAVGMDDAVKARPLAFLAQFDCGELAQYDCEQLLPNRGLLSFFYEVDSEPWGYDPKDAGCARVFWFGDSSILTPGEYPADLDDDFKFPMICIRSGQDASLPGWEDFSEAWPNEDDEQFETARKALGVEELDVCSKLLGWPDVIQNSMAKECELVTQGYYLGSGWGGIPKEAVQRAEQTALKRWRLLFQLDMVENGDFCLMFGDCGRIYFYIPKEDLLARRFDRVWLILQCC